jgi:hypothetical protein
MSSPKDVVGVLLTYSRLPALVVVPLGPFASDPPRTPHPPQIAKSEEYNVLLGNNDELEDQARLVSKLRLDVETLKERIVELEEENTKLLEERPHCYLAMRERWRACCKKACVIM